MRTVWHGTGDSAPLLTQMSTIQGADAEEAARRQCEGSGDAATDASRYTAEMMHPFRYIHDTRRLHTTYDDLALKTARGGPKTLP